MPSKHHIPQLFLKLLWTRRTWGEYKIKSTNYVSYSKLNHCECREAKQLKRGCVGVHVILGTRWRMCATVLASAHEVIMPGHAGTHRTMSQVTPDHEPGCTRKHVSYLCPHTCRMQSRHSVFFLPWFPLSIPTLLAKSPSHDGPSVSLTFPLPNPTFLFSNYSQWTKKNEIGKKMFS